MTAPSSLRARDLGLSIDRIRQLVGLWQQGRPSREVKRIALEHVAVLRRCQGGGVEIAQVEHAFHDAGSDHRRPTAAPRRCGGRA